MPNFAYSVALAAFQLSQGKDEEKLRKADSLLQEALLAFPSVLLPLLDKCSIEPHPGLMGEQYFLDSRGESPALATLCSLYVCRTFHCWKEPEILPWLERGVVAVLERLKNGDARALASKEERSTRCVCHDHGFREGSFLKTSYLGIRGFPGTFIAMSSYQNTKRLLAICLQS